MCLGKLPRSLSEVLRRPSNLQCNHTSIRMLYFHVCRVCMVERRAEVQGSAPNLDPNIFSALTKSRMRSPPRSPNAAFEGEHGADSWKSPVLICFEALGLEKVCVSIFGLPVETTTGGDLSQASGDSGLHICALGPHYHPAGRRSRPVELAGLRVSRKNPPFSLPFRSKRSGITGLGHDGFRLGSFACEA